MKELSEMLELLSPAGSPEAVIAAVQNGADAVYLGLGDFNARRGAKNFSIEEFRKAVGYCHILVGVGCCVAAHNRVNHVAGYNADQCVAYLLLLAIVNIYGVAPYNLECFWLDGEAFFASSALAFFASSVFLLN